MISYCVNPYCTLIILKASDAFLKAVNLWMKTIYYPNEIRSHFTPKATSKLRSALHFRYSIVIPRFIPRVNKAQS